MKCCSTINYKMLLAASSSGGSYITSGTVKSAGIVHDVVSECILVTNSCRSCICSYAPVYNICHVRRLICVLNVIIIRDMVYTSHVIIIIL